MRMERIKTGGGPPGYFPPDEILDRVAALLGSTGEGLTVRFGGDAEPQLIGDSDGDGSVGTAYIVPADHPMLLIDTPLPVENPTPSMDYTSVSMGNEVPANGIGDELVSLGTPNIHSIEKRNFKTSGGVKRKLLKPDNGCIGARNEWYHRTQGRRLSHAIQSGCMRCVNDQHPLLIAAIWSKARPRLGPQLVAVYAVIIQVRAGELQWPRIGRRIAQLPLL
ncbi:unnamed protein product [Colias eurytheme]|nr:unnamed protein product [Colias eurytheme]